MAKVNYSRQPWQFCGRFDVIMVEGRPLVDAGFEDREKMGW